MNYLVMITLTAEIAYEANRSLCMALGEKFTPDPWEMVDDAAKAELARAVAFVLDHGALTPEENHERWLKQRRSDGWVPGPVKDPKTKEHPDMVEWKDLGATGRAKNELFLGIVRALGDLSETRS